MKFSSPHGDFSFSIVINALVASPSACFRPLTGISLFLSFVGITNIIVNIVFVPSRGFLFFYGMYMMWWRERLSFSSPHGDFSFSLGETITIKDRSNCFRPLTGISLFLCIIYFHDCGNIEFSSPHGDFSFSMQIRKRKQSVRQCFRPLTGISLFL